MPLFVLILLASFAGINTVKGGSGCEDKAHYLGSFDPDLQQVSLCPDVATQGQRSLAEVARHEFFHAIQHRFGYGGKGFLPDSLLTPLVRYGMDDREVMTVLTFYPEEEVNGELEARLASRIIPNALIAGALISGALIKNNSVNGPIAQVRAFLIPR